MASALENKHLESWETLKTDMLIVLNCNLRSKDRKIANEQNKKFVLTEREKLERENMSLYI